MRKITLYLILLSLFVVANADAQVTKVKTEKTRNLTIQKLTPPAQEAKVGDIVAVTATVLAQTPVNITYETVSLKWAAAGAIIKSVNNHVVTVEITSTNASVTLNASLSNDLGSTTINASATCQIPVRRPQVFIEGPAHLHYNRLQSNRFSASTVLEGSGLDIYYEWDVEGFSIYTGSNQIYDKERLSTILLEPSWNASNLKGKDIPIRVRATNKKTGNSTPWESVTVTVRDCRDSGYTPDAQYGSKSIDNKSLTSVKVHSFRTGAIVHQEKGIENFDINNTGLARGIYVVEMKNTNGEVETVKVSKTY